MDFFYTHPQLIHADHLTIEGDEFSHLTHVMRKGVGDSFAVVDGRGNQYAVVIRRIERKVAWCEIGSHVRNAGEPPVAVHLGVGMLKNGSRFDYLVEKSTELGVCSITPLTTERTIKGTAKTGRWKKIALAAMKQSGRSVLPEIRETSTFEQFVQSAAREAELVVLHEKAPGYYRCGAAGSGSVIACVGPEGGFTDEEIAVSAAAGFRPVRIAPRRLRTETAAVAAVALCADAGQRHDDQTRRKG
ncbi:MAG: 16S rRNA (uracil(1498)-N(3))-methyltransferase [Ignavibacteria bacterium]|nr:16S rRNA (uracil(1498)-N(3))-methyltransferase [Ignavibacteria bacterium]